MLEDKSGTHVHHCCLRHGCKYGHSSQECPVAAGVKAQKYRCEYCDEDWKESGKPKCGVVFTCKNPGYWKWQGRANKVIPGVGSIGIFFFLCDQHDADARKPSFDVFAAPVEKRVL